MITEPVAPVLHVGVLAANAVSVALLPAQTVLDEATIAITGTGVTTILIVIVLLQPPEEPVTVNVVFIFG